MLLVFDADGLIKLNGAGLLARVLELNTCIIPRAVYDEAVVDANVKGHEDAREIEAALQRWNITPVPKPRTPGPQQGLGMGEEAILAILDDFEDAIVVSDDRRFLAVLAVTGRPFLTPADFPVVLARDGDLSVQGAKHSLELLRPAISKAAFEESMTDIDAQVGEPKDHDQG